jgi:DNA-binding NarL/FixJ family response regulator
MTKSTPTACELEIMSLSAMGLTEKKIARRLKRSENTVRVHVENVKRRLGAANKTHAVVILIARGLICPSVGERTAA